MTQQVESLLPTESSAGSSDSACFSDIHRSVCRKLRCCVLLQRLFLQRFLVLASCDVVVCSRNKQHSSFNDKPVNEAATGPLGKELFEKEQEDLLADLKDIPKKACHRRINEFAKRARAAKVHAYIISHLKKEMPTMMGKAKTQQRLIDNLEDASGKVQREFHLPPGDFPNVEYFREILSGYSIDKFERLKPKMIQAVDDMLGYDIPDLLKHFRNPYD